MRVRSTTGSSLRAQGSRRDWTDRPVIEGFIPACAGEPRRTRPTPTASGVHPCVRRGAFYFKYRVRVPSGSSLRAQGSHILHSRRARLCGFIPACAGEPRPLRQCRRRSGVHPCVRRGAPSKGSKRRFSAGSSLRAQGSLISTNCRVEEVRFIPACAGEP